VEDAARRAELKARDRALKAGAPVPAGRAGPALS